MNYTKLILAAVLCILCVSASAQDNDVSQNNENVSYQIPTFDTKGLCFSVNYQTAHIDGKRFRTMPLTAGYKFNPKMMIGINLLPTVCTTPEERIVEHYFTVAENGDFVYGDDEVFYKPGNSKFLLPIAAMFRCYMTGDRINSPYFEASFGMDVVESKAYLQYMAGARFGIGQDNSKAFIIGAGVVINNAQDNSNYDFGARLALNVGFEF